CGEGRLELVERGGGVTSSELDLPKVHPACRLQPAVAESRRLLQGLPVEVERLVWIAEIAPDAAEVVQGGDLASALPHFPAQLQGLFQKRAGALRLSQAVVGGADVVEQSGLQQAVAERLQDLQCLTVEAQGFLPLPQRTATHAEVVEDAGLFDAVSELPPQGEGLAVGIQRGVGLPQEIVDAAKGVEDLRLLALVAEVAEERAVLLVAVQCRRHGSTRELEEAEIPLAHPFIESLSEALPQGERALQGLAGPRGIPHVRAGQSELVQGGRLAMRFGKLPPERQRLGVVLNRRPQLALFSLQHPDSVQGFGLPAGIPERAPRGHGFTESAHGPAPRLGSLFESLLTGATHQRQGCTAVIRSCRQRLCLNRVTSLRRGKLSRVDLEPVLASAFQQEDLRSPAKVPCVDRKPGGRPLRLDDQVDTFLLDCDEELGIRHLDPIDVRFPTGDRPLADLARQKGFALLLHSED